MSVKSGWPQIGLRLPVRPEPYQSTQLLPFFANLMSEGWVKRHQAKLARLDQDDKFGLLLGHGTELIGPIRILPDYYGAEHSVFDAALEAAKSNLKGYSINFPRSEFNEIAISSLGRVSISGVQPKMFLTHASGKGKLLTSAQGMGPYIVKPSPSVFPELAENEFIIMRLCKKVGFNVADHHLVPFSCGENAYVTSRFDVDEHGKKHDFIEDLASVLNAAPSNKSSDLLSYELAIKEAHRHCGGHAQVLRDGFLQVLMAYIVGNNDLHLKNLSLQRNKTSNVASGFTPVYDMLSVAPYKTFDLSGELSIWLLQSETVDGFSTTSKEDYGYYTGNDFLALADATGLGERAGLALMQELGKKINKVMEKVLEEAQGSQSLKEIIHQRIIERLATLTRKKRP